MACKKPLGPGPGAYRLPTTVGFNLHDPSRYRNPMFSFGTHAGFRLKRLSPGPAYRIDRITREGLMTSPAWSFGARFPTRGILRTPGPGAHAPERCPQTREPRAPQYSMGARLGFGLKRPGPAPNAYALRLGPGTPAYTMGARVGFNLKAKSPGPAVYFQRDADVYKTKSPHYSLGARAEGAGKPTKTPGPATYPPNLYNIKKNPYSYSFGTKHGDYAPPLIVKEDTMDCL
ncbi:outer dense fiber protein 3-like [Pararge aegeria]|uniref:outer dense fiber protein 3-like n=1 Tax=Pararge aegeria TaxID=116150 RepID=UPI0019D12D87|nr:outer dense fiber protein 3-like [Pararge aegeria]